jgi:hypothetical protein
MARRAEMATKSVFFNGKISHTMDKHLISSAVEWITPEMASAMLAANTANRKVLASHLKRLEATFRAGEMKLNGDAIRISSSGVLLDGQHRLMACANTGIGFSTLVVRGLSDEVFDTIDQTRAPRKLSCVFSMSGEANCKTLAAALSQLHVFKQSGQFYDGGSARHYLSAHSARELLDKHPAIRDSVASFQVKTNYVWRTATPAVLHYMFGIVDHQLAEQFRDILHTGADDKDRPFNRLRESLIKARSVGNLSSRHDAARAIKAFNYERAGVSPKLLTWTSAMDFPVIEGLDVESL